MRPAWEHAAAHRQALDDAASAELARKPGSQHDRGGEHREGDVDEEPLIPPEDAPEVMSTVAPGDGFLAQKGLQQCGVGFEACSAGAREVGYDQTRVRRRRDPAAAGGRTGTGGWYAEAAGRETREPYRCARHADVRRAGGTDRRSPHRS